MTLTFLDLYNECAGQPWSMYDNEVENAEDLESAMKISINKAVSYVWNLHPWIFRKYNTKIKTRPTKNLYSSPDGLIAKKMISGSQKYCVKYDGNYLEYASNYPALEVKEGEPESFYIDGEDMYIYPTPNDTYTISVDYYLLPLGIREVQGEEIGIYELEENNDRINIPEKFEVYFKNVVISKAMLYAITDTSDENDSGYREQYNDALNVLLKNCYDNTKERRIII